MKENKITKSRKEIKAIYKCKNQNKRETRAQGIEMVTFYRPFTSTGSSVAATFVERQRRC